MYVMAPVNGQRGTGTCHFANASGGDWRGGGGLTRTARGGVEQLGLTHTEMRQGMWWTTRMRRGVGSQNRKMTPATTSTSPVCRLLDFANEETTPQGTGHSGSQKALARHSTRREARRTVHGPLKKPQPDRMSHRGVRPVSPIS